MSIVVTNLDGVWTNATSEFVAAHPIWGCCCRAQTPRQTARQMARQTARRLPMDAVWFNRRMEEALPWTKNAGNSTGLSAPKNRGQIQDEGCFAKLTYGHDTNPGAFKLFP